MARSCNIKYMIGLGIKRKALSAFMFRGSCNNQYLLYSVGRTVLLLAAVRRSLYSYRMSMLPAAQQMSTRLSSKHSKAAAWVAGFTITLTN